MRLLKVLMISVIIILSFSFPGDGHADDPKEGWDSVETTRLDYWVKKFALEVGQLKKIEIGESFFEEGKAYQFREVGEIYGLTVSGSIELHSDNSLVRVILVDDNLQEYLVYEAYPRIVEDHSFSFNRVCEETCILDSIKPLSVRLDLVDASITIDDVTYANSTLTTTIDIHSARQQIKQNHDAEKIGIINGKNLKWVAGETSISKLTYEEKKKLFGVDKVPNLQGAEFYKGGIFEIKSSDSLPSTSIGAESLLTEFFDWRNRHGADDPDSPYYDGDSTGSGWITSVKNQRGCGSCWAFAATGATEALANVYFNKHIDLDLSEQEALSCSGAGSCKGGWPGETLDYYTSDGVVDEACFPYTAQDDACDTCPDPDEIIKISGKITFSGTKTEEKLKRMIMEHGPISGGIYSWSHAMTLVGYGKDTADKKTFWIFKNSWGDWGDHGYGYIKVEMSDIGWTHALLHPVVSLLTTYQIGCFDYDGDGYYNWGISEDKPTSCAKKGYSQKDCDDSNPHLGPFAADGSCVEISIPGNVFSPSFDDTSTWVVYKDTDNKDTNVMTFADGGAPGERYKVVVRTTTGDTINYLFTGKGSGYAGCDQSAYDGEWPGYRKIGLGSNAGYAKLLKMKMIKRSGTGTRNAYVGFVGSGEEGWTHTSGPADGCGWPDTYGIDDALIWDETTEMWRLPTDISYEGETIVFQSEDPDGDDTEAWMADISATTSGNVFSPTFKDTSTWAVYKDKDSKDTRVITFADAGAPGEKYKVVVRTTTGDTINYLFTSKGSGYSGCDKSAYDSKWPGYRRIELGINAGFATMLKMKMIKRSGTGSRNAYVGFLGKGDEGWTQTSGPDDGCGW